MFEFDISDVLQKKLSKFAKKDKVLVKTFKKKVLEVINHDHISINTYKNLKSPKNEFKRIHLTDNFILLFKVYSNENKIVFYDILHWDNAYK